MASHPNYGTNKWPGRPPKQRCQCTRSDGQPCGNWAVVGYQVCVAHGGRAALANIKHGGNSKRVAAMVQGELMMIQRKLQRLTEQGWECFTADTDRELTLDRNQKLAQVMINESLMNLLKLEERLEAIQKRVDKLMDQGVPGKQLEVMVAMETGLMKEVNRLRSIIQGQQSGLNGTLKVRHELREKNETDDLLRELNQSILEVEAEEC